MNRTADGRFAKVKEAQRTDAWEEIRRLLAAAKQALRIGSKTEAQRLVNQVLEMKAAWRADYAEEI